MIETRYIDLSDKIEKGIKDGLWKERLPGVIKLSKELNADPATLSKAFRVLAGKGLVTIQGKKGTYITQPGRGVKHKVIGVVGIKTDTPGYSEEFSAMEKAAEASGYRAVGIAHKNDLFVKDLDLLLKFPVDGYIFMYSRLTFEIAAFLRENGVPFVYCNRPVGIPGVNWVDFDSEGSFEKAVRYFIGLGHKKIAYFEFHNPNYKFSERILNTYKKVLSETGLPFDKSLFISKDVAPYYKIHGEDYLRIYGVDCANDIMKQKEKPTAALTTDSDMAYGFIEELKKYNLNVPADISVISYNSHYAQGKDNFLTTLFNDYKKRSAGAVKMIVDLIASPCGEAKQKLIEGRIIPGKSSSRRKGDANEKT